jgi:autotransporter-associated beta strand protein
MKKTLLATVVAILLSSPTMAQNYGFEDGNLSGWTVGGDTGPTPTTGTVNGFTGTVNNITQQGMGVKLLNGPIAFQAQAYGAMGTPGTDYYQPAVTAKTWVFSPYGNYMVGLQPNQGQSAAAFTALGLQNTDIGVQDNSIVGTNKWTPGSINYTVQAQKDLAGYGNTGITTAAWIYRDVAMTPGTSLKFGWNYVGTDYVPFNDGSIATLVNTTDPTILGTVNNYNARYALLGFTNPKTGDYSAGTFGSTGWQIAVFDVTTAGTYKLGFASFNLGDTALSPLLLVDEWQGSTVTCATGTCTTFGVVAPNNSTAPTADSAGGSGSGGSSSGGGSSTPTTVNDITATTTTSTLGTTPVFNGGTVTIADGDVIAKNFGITNAGGTVNTGAGLVGEITGVISNDGASTTGQLTVDGSGTLKLNNANTYTGPTVVNNGAFLVLLNGNAVAYSTSVTNNGGINITGAGNSTAISGNYTQGSNGGLIATLTPTGATQLNVTGQANLAGTYTLHANQGPYAYGKYTLITASGVTGQFDTFATNLDSAYGNYLKYSGNDVKLYVTPSASATQVSIDTTSANLSNAINLQSSAVTNALGNDCAVFGETGSCVSVNVGQSKAGTGDLFNGGVTVGKKINDNWRAGIVTNAPFSNPTIGNVSQTSNPAYGMFATWTKDKLSVQGSAAVNQGDLTITRNGPETGVGKSSVDNKAVQLRASYDIPVNDTVTVTPYTGVRYMESNYSGYTETGPAFPLTVNNTKRTSTSILAGVTVAKQLTEKLNGNVSAGIIQNLTGRSATFTGTSEIAGLSTFSNTIPSNGSTNPTVGAGLSYSVDKNTKIGANVGWQASGSNADISSIGISLTRGF